jgi:hypothetical protein
MKRTSKGFLLVLALFLAPVGCVSENAADSGSSADSADTSSSTGGSDNEDNPFGDGGTDSGDTAGGNTSNRAARSCPATEDPVNPKTILHIGHSLTDRMAPLLNHLLESESGESVDYMYKTATGTSLTTHWNQPNSNGKGNMSTPPLQALRTPGLIDVLSMTEKLPMHWGKGEDVEAWAGEFLDHSTNPNPEVFIYSTWGQRNRGEPDTPETIQTWLDAFEAWEPIWESFAQRILDEYPNASVGIIPAGRVFEELQLRVLDGSLILPNGLNFRETFFKRNRPGRLGGCAVRDHIHLSRAGIYTSALTHYATIYCASPIGLPSTIPFPNYDDTCVEAEEVAVDPELAAVIQEVVWEVVRDYSWAGVD